MSTDSAAFAWAVAALLTTTAAAQEAVEINGTVVDADTEEAPREGVRVWYEEFGAVYEPVFADTENTGGFTFDLVGGMGKFGLLSVREPGYNSAVLGWPVPADTDIVFRLSKPIRIYGKLVNASGVPVSGAMLKWSMPHDDRLTSGTGIAEQDGTFGMLVPGKSDALRLAAWADLYASTKIAAFSYDSDEAPPPTVLKTLENMRGDAKADDQYLQDWIDEILSSQEPATELAPR